MAIQEILNTVEHRPWNIPSGSWKYYQEWNNALFLHWQVELNELKRFVPEELEIDLYDSKPWVSIVAFTMEKIRPKNLPAFPPISNFHEINIRTYVKSKNKTGVYFLSIEGGTNLSCKVARVMSELPYRFSEIQRTESQYKSYNPEFNDGLDIEYNIEKKLQKKTELDKWLTERYALLQDSKNSINEFEIHHLEWPLNKIDFKKLDISYPRFDRLIKGKPDKCQYSEGVEVVAWGKKQIGKTSYNRAH